MREKKLPAPLKKSVRFLMQILFSQNPARRFDCAFLFSNRLASDGKARRFTHRNHLCHIDNKHLSISKRCQFISRTRLVYCRAHQLHDFVHDFWMLIVFFSSLFPSIRYRWIVKAEQIMSMRLLNALCSKSAIVIPAIASAQIEQRFDLIETQSH